MQVALYARVSTPRQYMNGLSVPDQLRQMRQWCERQGHVVVREYVETELKEIEKAEAKLYEAIEKGVLDLDDRLKDRVRQHKARREEVITELAALKQASQSPLQSLTPQKIQAVANTLNKRFGISTPFSRAYLKATLREIRTDGKFLKISGDSKMMANLIAANGDIDPQNAVLRFIPEWRAEGDESAKPGWQLVIPVLPLPTKGRRKIETGGPEAMVLGTGG